MSPLDMFAAQSRALAKKLEDERKNDRRVSRLPPLAVAEGIGRKPEIHGGPSTSPWSATTGGSPQRERDVGSSPDDAWGNKREIENPAFRPKSYYPRLSKVSATPESDSPRAFGAMGEDVFPTPMEVPASPDYFGSRQTRSPEPFAPVRPSMESISQHSSHTSSTRPKKSLDSVNHTTELVRGLSIESTSSRVSQYSRSLQPPNPPYARHAPSLQSASSDDESSSFSQQRKLSSSSNMSLPLSPQFAYSEAHNRSTSQLSEYSVNSNRLSRPAFNFSRPLSRASRPSIDSPTRMSMESHTRPYGQDDVQTPISADHTFPADSESFREGEMSEGNSYVYSKFSLPRGRMLGRDSLPPDPKTANFELDQSKRDRNNNPANPKQNLPALKVPLPTPPSSVDSDRPRVSTDGVPLRPPAMAASKVNQRHSMTSMNTMNTQDSGSTIKAKQRPSSTELTAEDHLTKGIACHEAGSLNESTYHFRLAARQNNPTAMLMYALACRHGWGMRKNPTEGVTWLRKAMDCASIEMSLDEEKGRKGDIEGRKKRRAQFALSVYELGVSHMNGWGIEQDKFLALRCFEIASSWGDADAMAEAGFCFAQGVGCKKDLKKAAKYYREAESKGMSMVGQSWYVAFDEPKFTLLTTTRIHKSKYDETPDERSSRADKDEKKDKKRDKSRNRSIFTRKKSTA